MAFCLDRALDGLDRTDLRGLNLFNLKLISNADFGLRISDFVNVVYRKRGNHFEGCRFFDRFRFERIDVDCRVIESAQRLVDVFELVLFAVERFGITNEMENDFGHAAWLAIA